MFSKITTVKSVQVGIHLMHLIFQTVSGIWDLWEVLFKIYPVGHYDKLFPNSRHVTYVPHWLAK
jgi:hypothetical protein